MSRPAARPGMQLIFGSEDGLAQWKYRYFVRLLARAHTIRRSLFDDRVGSPNLLAPDITASILSGGHDPRSDRLAHGRYPLPARLER